MKIRSLLLASAVVPFVLPGTSSAADAVPPPVGLILAQAEETCPEGTECPEVDRAAPEQGATQEQQPAAEEPATEESRTGEPPAAEQPAAGEQPATEEQTAEPEQRDQQEPSAVEEPSTAQEQPAAEEPSRATEEQAAPAETQDQGVKPRKRQRALERARKRQQELHQQEQAQPQTEQPATEEPAAAEAPAAEEKTVREQPSTAEDSTVEQQLEAQGDQEEAKRVRRLRDKLEQEREAVETAEPEAGQEQAASPDGSTEGAGDQGRRDRLRDRGKVVERRGDRIIIDLGGGRIEVEHADRYRENERFLYGARDVEVQRLPRGRTRTVVYRDDGTQIITVRNRFGDVIQRIRRTPDGREIVLFDNRFDERDYPVVVFDPRRLPPPVISIPREQYIVDLGRASPRQIQGALLAPPVQPIEQQYTLDEVTQNEQLRAYVPRIDLDTITFEFGSATVGPDQMGALSALGQAMEDVIAEHPDEVYLIEGHTDAVGSDYDNLILSDRRAEAVAVALSQNFDVPPENLVTEGYGEQYLKVNTPAPERQNRRVTVRRITPLLQTEAAQ